MRLSPLRVFLLLGGVALAPLACRDRGTTRDTGCNADSECGSPASAFRCETQTGACFCRSDDACDPRQFCNTAGFCQDKTGCEKNSDCGTDEALYCDTTTGTCLSRGRCTSDLHCSLGQVCDFARSTCVDGCRTHGDCPGNSCRCGDGACGCDAGTPEELAQCAIGVCDSDFCASANFCAFGEVCAPPADGGTTLNQCYSDFHPDRRPYCSGCTSGGGLQTCGSGPNYCLIDTAHPGNYFCGVDCSDGQACPRGYGCQDVVVVYTQWQCTRSNPTCPPNPSLPCSDDSECKRGGTCVKPMGQATGNCAAKCSLDEGDDVGFCSCQVDQDCAQETCSAGECTISRKQCTQDTDCRTIRCVDYQGAGGCFIGQNCAPANGLSCLEVQ